MPGQVYMKIRSRKCEGYRGPYKLSVMQRERSKRRSRTWEQMDSIKF